MNLSREKKRELVDQLRSAGCCDRCTLRFLKVTIPSKYNNAKQTLNAMTSSADSTGAVPNDSGADSAAAISATPSPCPQDAALNSTGSTGLSEAERAEVASSQSSTLADSSGGMDTGLSRTGDDGDVTETGLSRTDGNGDEDDVPVEPSAKYRQTASGDRQAVGEVLAASDGSTCTSTLDPVGDAEAMADQASSGVASVTVAVTGSPTPSSSACSSAICVSCLGILEDSWIDDIVTQVHARVEADDYQFSSFSFSIFFPLASLVRERALVAAIDNEFKPSSGVPQVKEVLKWVSSPRMQKKLNVKFELNSPFQISVVVEHSESEPLISTLIEKCPERFPGLARSKVKPTAAAVNVTSLAKALQAIADSDMHSWFTCPLPTPGATASLDLVSCQHGSIYIAGRYCKYSRTLSQTPWVIDGQRKTEKSVQELICDALQEEAKARDIKFCSSGREDVDVRMLGKGRPFCVELVNPRRCVISAERIAELQLVINGSSDDVQVRDLQLIDKTGVDHMKEGEAEKIKHYRALIFVAAGVESVDLTAISDTKELVLHQKTPLRVLHRRTLMNRERTVHQMSSKAVDSQHFHLFLSTQAGTYIKEFVHGDLGRTMPNLGSLLKSSLDIVELDVMDVDLDWPPALA